MRLFTRGNLSHLIKHKFKLTRQKGNLFVSFRKEITVMHSATGSGKYSCQNMLVHPNYILGGSTKFHAFNLKVGCHQPPPLLPTPSSQKWKFQLRTGLRKFEVHFCKLAVTNPTPPLEMGLWDFSNFGNWLSRTAPPPPPNSIGNLGFKSVWTFGN